jgi:hypothetical protein
MALIGYQAELSRIEQKMAEIRRLVGGQVTPVAAKKAATKPALSASARARIAAAQKKRWAEYHKSKEAAAAPERPKAKRRISEEGMKRIVAATKKRWAAKKAAAAKPEPIDAKKVLVKKAAVKTSPAKVAKKVVVQKATPRKSAPAKVAKAPAKKAAKMAASVTTGAAESAPTPAVVA